MTIGILGKKLGMTQLFHEDGRWVPVTVLQAGPCTVLQVKTKENSELHEEHRSAATNHGKKRGASARPRRADGYYSVQLGFDDTTEKRSTKPEVGHAAKAGTAPKKFVREFRCAEKPSVDRGDAVDIGILKDVKWVDVTGTSKGRGFAGGIKRYGFQRQRMTHGNSKAHRKIGGTGRTYSTMKGLPKGKKMPGHYGAVRTTTQSLQVVRIDEERNLLFIRGAVPGHKNGYVEVRQAVKRS